MYRQPLLPCLKRRMIGPPAPTSMATSRSPVGSFADRGIAESLSLGLSRIYSARREPDWEGIRQQLHHLSDGEYDALLCESLALTRMRTEEIERSFSLFERLLLRLLP